MSLTNAECRDLVDELRENPIELTTWQKTFLAMLARHLEDPNWFPEADDGDKLQEIAAERLT